MGQGMSCDFVGAIDEVTKTVEEVQRQGVVGMIQESLLAETPINATLIRPGTPEQTNLPWRNYADQFLDGLMAKGLRRTHMGLIVFSGETIGMFEDDTSILEEKFELESDLEIHCRAYWPRALRNYPLGVQPDGKPAYGPEYIIYSSGSSGRNTFEFVCNCYINGQRITEPTPVEGVSFWHSLDRGHSVAPAYTKPGAFVLNKEKTDWWAYTQTRRWVVLGSNSDDTEDGQAVIRLGREVAKLPQGSHKFRLELCFRVLPGEGNKGLFPSSPTPLSYPIAVGEFTLEVTEDSKSVQKKLQEANKLPKRVTSISDSECDRIEEGLWKLFKNSEDGWGGHGVKPEQPLHIVVTGEWYQINEGTRRAPIYKWIVPLQVVSKRRAALGWHKDHYVVVGVNAVTPNYRKEANFTHITVPLGSDSEIPAEFIPEELKSSSSRRATEKARKERIEKEKQKREDNGEGEEESEKMRKKEEKKRKKEEKKRREEEEEESSSEEDDIPF